MKVTKPMINEVRRSRRGALAAIPVIVLGLTVLSATPGSASGLTVLSATPASASAGDVTVMSHTSVNTDGNTTEVSETTSCPSGSTLVGAGWSAGYQVIVDEVVPDVTTGTVRVEAWEEEDRPPSSNWNVTARAICADGVSGVSVEDDVSVYDSALTKSASASCGFAKKVVGLGYEIITAVARGEVHVTSIVPSEDEVRVTAYEDDTGTGSSWSIIAYAVCATAPPGLQIVPSPSPSGSVDTTSCPDGKKAIGAGGALDGAERDVNIRSAKTGVFGDEEYGQVGALEDVDGTTANWTVATTVICAFS